MSASAVTTCTSTSGPASLRTASVRSATAVVPPSKRTMLDTVQLPISPAYLRTNSAVTSPATIPDCTEPCRSSGHRPMPTTSNSIGFPLNPLYPGNSPPEAIASISAGEKVVIETRSPTVQPNCSAAVAPTSTSSTASALGTRPTRIRGRPTSTPSRPSVSPMSAKSAVSPSTSRGAAGEMMKPAAAETIGSDPMRSATFWAAASSSTCTHASQARASSRNRSKDVAVRRAPASDVRTNAVLKATSIASPIAPLFCRRNDAPATRRIADFTAPLANRPAGARAPTGVVRSPVITSDAGSAPQGAGPPCVRGW